MTWCGKNIDYDFNVNLDFFISTIVDREVRRVEGCLKEIRVLMNDNDLIN